MSIHPLPDAALKGEGLTSQRVRDGLVSQLATGGIVHPRVLALIGHTPRHLFIDQALHAHAYENTALPIGHDQTISQPWVVARMSELLLEHLGQRAGKPWKVLEIGTGSGYQAVILAGLGGQVYTLERIGLLLRQARRRFRQLGLDTIRSRHEDGCLGWPGEAPFDAIILTAANEVIPEALLDQLKPEGVVIAPLGPPGHQRLVRVCADHTGQCVQQKLDMVSFVPLRHGID